MLIEHADLDNAESRETKRLTCQKILAEAKRLGLGPKFSTVREGNEIRFMSQPESRRRDLEASMRRYGIAEYSGDLASRQRAMLAKATAGIC